MIGKRIFIVSVFIFNITVLWSQYAVLSIKSADSLLFDVSVNDKVLSDSAAVIFNVTLSPTNSLLGNIHLTEDSTIYIPFDLILEEGYNSVFNLQEVNSRYFLVPFTKSKLDSTFSVNDSIFEARNMTISAALAIPSVVGCSPPSRNFGQLLGAVEGKTFAYEKEKLITKIIEENCLLTNQLFQLINILDYEDKKFNLIAKAYENTYDLNNFGKLNELFLLEKYQEMFDDFLEGKE